MLLARNVKGSSLVEDVLEDETVTIRHRDDRRQSRIKVDEAVEVVRTALRDNLT